jgi:hypothetical protein
MGQLDGSNESAQITGEQYPQRAALALPALPDALHCSTATCHLPLWVQPELEGAVCVWAGIIPCLTWQPFLQGRAHVAPVCRGVAALHWLSWVHKGAHLPAVWVRQHAGLHLWERIVAGEQQAADNVNCCRMVSCLTRAMHPRQHMLPAYEQCWTIFNLKCKQRLLNCPVRSIQVCPWSVTHRSSEALLALKTPRSFYCNERFIACILDI